MAWGASGPKDPLHYRSLRYSADRLLRGVVALTFTVYICYRFAKRTTALLGENGVNVVIRLSAFILLCIGIQVLWTGYSTLVIAPRA